MAQSETQRSTSIGALHPLRLGLIELFCWQAVLGLVLAAMLSILPLHTAVFITFAWFGGTMYFERGKEVRLPLEYSMSCAPLVPAMLIQPWLVWGLFAAWVASILLVVRIRGSRVLARHFLWSAVVLGLITCAIVVTWMDHSTRASLRLAIAIVPWMILVWALYVGVMVAAFVQLAAVFTEWASGCIGKIGSKARGITIGPEPK